MRLLSRLEDERISGTLWYAIFRQSPKCKILPKKEISPCSHNGSMLESADEGDRKVQAEAILGE
jgi:hypothetical protein